MICTVSLLFVFLYFLFLVELCLTSNVKGQTVPCYSKHHFKYWYELGHPSVICVSFLLCTSQVVKLIFKTSCTRLKDLYTIYIHIIIISIYVIESFSTDAKMILYLVSYFDMWKTFSFTSLAKSLGCLMLS